jgi:hypothetical protein
MLWTIVAIAAEPCPGNQAKDEGTLLQLEQTWARSLEQHDATAIACLLGEEFQDADVDGAVHNRAEALARVPQRRPGTNRLEDLHARIYGDTAFVRGINQVLDPSGKTLARVRFTDIFVYRDGRWQAVAGHETLFSEKKD